MHFSKTSEVGAVRTDEPRFNQPQITRGTLGKLCCKKRGTHAIKRDHSGVQIETKWDLVELLLKRKGDGKDTLPLKKRKPPYCVFGSAV